MVAAKGVRAQAWHEGGGQLLTTVCGGSGARMELHGDGPDGGHRPPLLLCVSKWSCSRPDTAQLPCCRHAAASRPSPQAAVLTAPK